MSTIIIQLEGGLVQDVFIKGTGKPSKATIVDFDIEGMVDGYTQAYDKEDCLLEAAIHTESIHKIPIDCDLDRLFKAYKKG